MTDTENRPTRSPPGTSDRDELRTIAFRMREIQRLLSVRVEQENRKLEAEGVDPVTNTRFVEDSITGDSADR